MPETGEPVAEQTRRLVLGGATAGVVARCRDFTRRALTDWLWPEGSEAEEDLLLLVSEVVTNACLHAGGPRELVLRHGLGLLRVEVSDDSPRGAGAQGGAGPLPAGRARAGAAGAPREELGLRAGAGRPPRQDGLAGGDGPPTPQRPPAAL
ncbi:LOW QUALITY PROTEIN: regulatory protein, partial [Streptomyces sp. C]